MSNHHPPRHCFLDIDFSDAPLVVIADFTEGEIYQYDFTDFWSLLVAFESEPTGHFFNIAVRPSAVPFTRLR
jgi:hypothetical protein